MFAFCVTLVSWRLTYSEKKDSEGPIFRTILQYPNSENPSFCDCLLLLMPRQDEMPVNAAELI